MCGVTSMPSYPTGVTKAGATPTPGPVGPTPTPTPASNNVCEADKCNVCNLCCGENIETCDQCTADFCKPEPPAPPTPAPAPPTPAPTPPTPGTKDVCSP